MTQTKFAVKERETARPNQLRRKGLIPANVYGDGKSKAVQVGYQEFIKLYDEAGENSLIYLSIEGENKPRPVLIAETQLDPLTGKIIHVAFQQVSLKEKISAEIPVEVTGEFKVAGGVLVVVKNTVEVEALPTDFPESFVFSAEQLTEIGQTITYKDLVIDKTKVTLVLGEEGEDEPLIIVQEQKEEVEETPVDETEGDSTEAANGQADTTETAE
ncbi:MAG: 50S ribosomal protein L25 [Candidatus Pacebacteria bacterium]|nr:50S ribosomal protein L25 [Candidatus Paceibacterota bacterium]